MKRSGVRAAMGKAGLRAVASIDIKIRL